MSRCTGLYVGTCLHPLRLSPDFTCPQRPVTTTAPNHAAPPQALAFSPDGRWLVSLGRDPERGVVVWDVAAGLLVAAGRTEQSPRAAAWLWGGHNPAFATAGADGLLLWTLQDK